MKKTSSKTLTSWGVVWLILFFPIGIILLIAAHKRRQVEQAEMAASKETAPTRRLSDEELKGVLDYVSRKHGVAPAAPSRSAGGDYDYKNVDVCILRSMDPDLSDVAVGDVAELVMEPENEADHRAVAVYIAGQHIGYLYRGKLKSMTFDFLERGDSVSAEVAAVDGVGVRLDISLSR